VSTGVWLRMMKARVSGFSNALPSKAPPSVSIRTQLPMLLAVDRIDPAGPTFSMLR
jgi:hypothetical protein